MILEVESPSFFWKRIKVVSNTQKNTMTLPEGNSREIHKYIFLHIALLTQHYAQLCYNNIPSIYQIKKSAKCLKYIRLVKPMDIYNICGIIRF